MEDVSFEIKFDVKTLQMRGVTPDGLKYYMEFLQRVFKNRFLELVPVNIPDTESLDHILILYKHLSGLQDTIGFEKHIAEYNKKRLHSTLFVSRLALFLKDKVDKLELEPITSENDGNPDLKISIGNQDAYIECKNIETSQFSDIDEHRKIYNVLKAYIEVPHQISFSYKETPGEETLKLLGESIKKLIPKVKIDGKIINNENFEVGIQLRDNYGDLRVVGVMDMIMEDNNTGERVPAHVFLEDGKALAIHGPDIDYKKILQQKVKNARNQSVDDNIFITAINTDTILGGINENIRCIESLFQPDKNTKYSSVLFVDNESLINNKNFTHILNPFAKVPLASEIKNLFTMKAKR